MYQTISNSVIADLVPLCTKIIGVKCEYGYKYDDHHIIVGDQCMGLDQIFSYNAHKEEASKFMYDTGAKYGISNDLTKWFITTNSLNGGAFTLLFLVDPLECVKNMKKFPWIYDKDNILTLETEIKQKMMIYGLWSIFVAMDKNEYSDVRKIIADVYVDLYR